MTCSGTARSEPRLCGQTDIRAATTPGAPTSWRVIRQVRGRTRRFGSPTSIVDRGRARRRAGAVLSFRSMKPNEFRSALDAALRPTGNAARVLAAAAERLGEYPTHIGKARGRSVLDDVLDQFLTLQGSLIEARDSAPQD